MHRQGLNRSPVVLGIAYKKNVDDVRESPAARIMELLREHQFELESVALDAKSLAAQDCVVLVTDHDAFDYPSIAAHAKLVVDTRGRCQKAAGNIVKA